ncbi:MAG: SRPBCC family protein [Gemmatimonadota bacterium]
MSEFASRSTDYPSGREVSFHRLLDAPRELVWSVCSDPHHLHRWWGPNGFTITTHEFSFVPGGEWLFIMHGPDGTDYPNRVIFSEIVPPSRLVYYNGWDLPGSPVDFTAVITLESEGAKTRFSQHMTFSSVEGFRTAVELYGVLEGGTQTLARLAEYVRGLG